MTLLTLQAFKIIADDILRYFFYCYFLQMIHMNCQAYFLRKIFKKCMLSSTIATDAERLK